ncbi:protein-tyrosine phosphatase-like protein [Lactarius quietus]|nr:protein-tyrosine phosphatase-like protein [Lactarius quietus]
MSFGVPFFELSFFQQYQNSLPSVIEQEKQHDMRPNRSAAKDNKRVASKIAPRLYLTCLSTARDVNQLTSHGITHVLSVLEKAPSYPSSTSLRTMHVPISDYDGEDILTHLPATTSFIRGALAESPNNRVLVHCFMGISRSATVVIAYLIATSQMTPHEALATVRAKRAIVRPNRGFMAQLHEYHSKCSNALQANVIDEPPTDEKKEQENQKLEGEKKPHSRRSRRIAAKGYVYSTLAALSLSPTTFPQEHFGGHEYWKLEHRIA